MKNTHLYPQGVEVGFFFALQLGQIHTISTQIV